MSGISNVGSYAYVPQSTVSYGSRREYNGIEDFKPGIFDPEAREKSRKRKRNVLIVLGLGVAAAAAYVLTKGKGKGFINKLKSLFKNSDDAIKQAGKNTPDITPSKANVKTSKAKVKTQKATVTEQVDIQPNKSQKMAGKDQAHKARRNEKKIIEETRLREQAESFTTKDLDELSASMRTPATKDEVAYMAANNKPATTSLGDVMTEQGITRSKKDNRVVLEQTPKTPVNKAPAAPANPTPAAPATPAPSAPSVAAKADNAAQIAELQAKLDKNKALAEKFGKTRYAKTYQAQVDELSAKIAELEKAAA